MNELSGPSPSEPAAPSGPRAPRSGPDPLPSRLAAALVFVASGAVLVLEVAGLRLVGPYVGVTLQSNSAVIGVSLGAIAYGAWTGGWLADRLDARRLLAPALLLAAAATAVVLPVVRYAGSLLRGTDPANVLLLTALVLFVPAALLSAVSPLVVKLQLGDLAQTGRVVGRLSSIGTVGGITATLVTGFVLVAALPTSAIVLGLAGLLALCGGLLLGYGRLTGGRPDPSPRPWRNPRAWRTPGAWRTPRAWRPFRRGPAGGLAALLGLAGTGFGAVGLALVAPEPCDVETAYHCARVAADPERPTGRTLWLNSAQHSYVDLADPRYLRYGYTRWLAALVDSMAPPGAPLSALHLGGGGFTLPGYLAATRPGSDNLVLELDGRLVDLDRARLGLRTGDRLRAVTGDARVNLARQPGGRRDLVIGDAFGHLSVPWHLTTRELVVDVRRTLRPGGVYAVNLIDRAGGRFARAEIATVATVFRHLAVIVPPEAAAGRAGANWVVVASDAPLPLDGITTGLAALAEPAARAELLSDAAVARLVAGVRILTDDYAPVEQMVVGW